MVSRQNLAGLISRMERDGHFRSPRMAGIVVRDWSP